MVREKQVGKLKVYIAQTAIEMGKTAAENIAKDLIALGKKKDTIRVMFAAAPSQNTMFEALNAIPDIPWEKVEAYHMDEYVGISKEHSASFRNFLDRSIFKLHPFKTVHYIEGDAACGAEAIAKEYDGMLRGKPLDMIVLGIGENGHIAFNDPPDADFNDPTYAKVIKLSERSRIQQVNDKCFEKLEEVPYYAITVTIPAFREAGSLHCIVPNERKAEAVRNTLEGPITDSCPASILREIDNSHLYIDALSASLLK